MSLNILYGPPGSGKTTAIQTLLERRDFSYISIGEIYRKELEKKSKFGEELRKYVEADIEYPEDVIRRIVEPYLLSIKKNETVILDGFPKHFHELGVLQTLIEQHPEEIEIGSIINLDIDLQTALGRMSKRLVCPRCDFQSDTDTPCPRCGAAKMVKRNDDNDDEFIARYNTYVKNNETIIGKLRYMGFGVQHISADGPKNEVRDLIDQFLFASLRHASPRQLFKKLTGLDSDIISTVDHPYVSPPVRLLDSHRILYELNKKQKVTLLNWDVSQANARTYRYDMQLDLLFVGRSKEHFLFTDGVSFAAQTAASVNMSSYETLYRDILRLLESSGKITPQQHEHFVKNYNELKTGVFNKFIDDDRLGREYTKRSLIAFNRLVGRDHIAQFIEDRYIYYQASPIVRSWIPYCIENVVGKRSFRRVLSSGAFGRRVFRSLKEEFKDDEINEQTFIHDNTTVIADLLREGKLIPSIELLYWSLEYAGVKHFGNDYEFFSKYGEYLGETLDNQITEMRGDGENYFYLDKDYGVSINPESGAIVSKGAGSAVKSTRINSMYAFYILLGDSMKVINDASFTYPREVSLASWDVTPESVA